MTVTDWPTQGDPTTKDVWGDLIVQAAESRYQDALTVAGGKAAGDDARLTDTRTPTDASVTLAKLAGDVTAALAGKTSDRGQWTAGTDYAAGDLVTNGEGLYVVTADHTAAAPFTLASKRRLNGSRGTYDVRDYGAVGDGKVIADGAITSGQTNLTSASNPWTAADVGKAILVNGAGTSSAPLVTTIAAFVNAGSVTLAAVAGSTIAAADCLWGTDDADAIRTALYAGVNAGVADGTRYCRLHLPQAIYVLSSAPKLGTFNPGVTGANAQTWGNSLIPLPAFPETGPKFVLAITGVLDGSAIAWFQQDRPHIAGTALVALRPQRTSLDGTWFEPSVIGGPTRDNFTASGGATNQSNLKLHLDGLQLVTLHNGGFDGVNAYNCVQLSVGRVGCTVFAHVGGTPNVQDLPTTGSVGLRAPRQLNNAESDIQEFTSYGHFYGLLSGDHLTAHRLLLLYSNTGWLNFDMGATWYHGAWAGYVCIEAANTAIQVDGSAGGFMPMVINYLDLEAVTTTFSDSTDFATGCINVQNAAAAPVVVGGGKMRIRSLDAIGAPGLKVPPALPATTVALKNPFWTDCAVTVIGGTVTAVAVAGQSLGATPGTVIVPTGKTITLTYSSAPTWQWIGL